ncbi:GAF domain-containing protein [Bauldia litoralis]|uniref:Pyridoxamine 5'-phosphate oxidase n=1 Tax=Bauldia litoralis TaxID=665467 RepID=A0A1G6EQL3_9HYPH|nr:GAF domain-containing protein [Bauldia litoralis]SDB59572.1 Pyridoxamine 5'-phosphate oxidase [Bauldia litoralis]
MTKLALDAIRDCFEGVVPAVLATCDADGVPNVSIISQVHYVDHERVALTYQFFNKTRRNLVATRAATVSVYDPVGLVDFRLDLDYEETQTDGPVFESMKAKLAGIASHTGMQGIFHLRGADICRVRSVVRMPAPAELMSPPSRNLLSAVRRAFVELAAARDLGDLFDRTLDCIRNHFGIEHMMILMLDEVAGRLFIVASDGYDRSGIGSELALGDGVVGVAARERVPIRIGHMTSEYSYGTAIRDQARDQGLTTLDATEIPYPGLDAPESQIALPILSQGRTLGVLFAESVAPMRFRYDDEDALALVADRLGELATFVQGEMTPSTDNVLPRSAALKSPVAVRHYQADDSVFLNHDYLIKGVAGAIFWKVVRERVRSGRVEFSNRELRLDPALRLPEHAENLEARLVLLQRRLRERSSAIQIEKCGRGRFRLVVLGSVSLEEIDRSGVQSLANF